MLKHFKYMLPLIWVISALPALGDSPETTDRKSAIAVTFYARYYSRTNCLEMTELPDGLTDYPGLGVALSRLFDELAKQGYPLAELDSVEFSKSTTGSDCRIFINEGKSVVASKITAPGLDGRLPPPSLRLTERWLAEEAQRLLESAVNDGFPYARITIIPKIDDASGKTIAAELTFKLDRGEFIRIGKIVFPGAVQTRARLLQLESRLERGMPFNARLIHNAELKLKRLSYLSDAGPFQIVDESPGVASVWIPVVEKRANRASGIVAMSPDARKPTGEIELELGNILGTGRKLSFQWLGLNPRRTGFKTAYSEPWIAGLPLRLGIGLNQQSNDTVGVTTGYRGSADWEPTYSTTVSGAITRETFSSDREDSDPSAQTLWVEVSLKYDRTDHEWNPSQGIRAEFASASGSRTISIQNGGSFHLRRESAGLETFHSLRRPWVLFVQAAASDIAGSGLTTTDLVRLGGAATVRGYPEDRFQARGAAWGSGELRWRPDPKGFLALTADAGYIYRTDHRAQPYIHKLFSGGFSAAMETGAGKIQVDVALASGEPIANTRIHLRLETWF